MWADSKMPSPSAPGFTAPARRPCASAQGERPSADSSCITGLPPGQSCRWARGSAPVSASYPPDRAYAVAVPYDFSFSSTRCNIYRKPHVHYANAVWGRDMPGQGQHRLCLRRYLGQRRATLPLRRQRVQTFQPLGQHPPSPRTFLTLGATLRLPLRLEWLTLWPLMAAFSHTSQNFPLIPLPVGDYRRRLTALP